MSDQLASLQSRLDALEADARRRRRVRTVLLSTAVVAALAAFGGFAANGNCPNTLPFCFTANQPAVARQVNHNDAQVKEWLERKLGPVTSDVLTTDAGVRVTTLNLALDTGALSTPRLVADATSTRFLGASGSTVAEVNPDGDAVFNQVQGVASGTENLPRNCRMVTMTPSTPSISTVTCPATEFVIAGGGNCFDSSVVTVNEPLPPSNGRSSGWSFECAQESALIPGTFTVVTPNSVRAVCCRF